MNMGWCRITFFLVKLTQHFLLLTSTALGDLSRDCGAQPFDEMGLKIIIIIIIIIIHRAHTTHVITVQSQSYVLPRLLSYFDIQSPVKRTISA